MQGARLARRDTGRTGAFPAPRLSIRRGPGLLSLYHFTLERKVGASTRNRLLVKPIDQIALRWVFEEYREETESNIYYEEAM